MGALLVPMGHGEIVDRATILEIKAERIEDPAALAHVRQELSLLREIEREVLRDARLRPLRERLRGTNEALWEVEDALRDHEARRDHGPSFVALARRVLGLNDQRATIKREINERTNSPLVEAKLYGKKPTNGMSGEG